MDVSWGGRVTLIIVCLALFSCPSCLAQRQENRISCFLLGSVYPKICPLPGYFTEDPLFTYEVDPQQAGLALDERRRLDRLYFPRSRQMLLDKFDMVFISDPRLDHFTAKQFGDLDYAFRKGNMPSFWAFGPSYGFISVTVLNEVLPITDYEGYMHRPWRVVFHEEREPVFTPFIALGMERIPGEAYGRMSPRQGSVVWADMVPYNLPWMVSWRPGGSEAGLSWVCADEFNMYWWGLMPETRGTNPYAIDLVTNLILYSLDRPVITSIHLRHEARLRMSSFRDQKLTVYSVLAWADKFGANIFGLSQELTELDSQIPPAIDSYLEQDYSSTISTMETLSLRLGEIGRDAIHLKDQALFWVFVAEWLVVSAAAIIGGVLVWGLMIRRRMYKDAGVTRISPIY